MGDCQFLKDSIEMTTITMIIITTMINTMLPLHSYVNATRSMYEYEVSNCRWDNNKNAWIEMAQDRGPMAGLCDDDEPLGSTKAQNLPTR
jgi:hypothetical protein